MNYPIIRFISILAIFSSNLLISQVENYNLIWERDLNQSSGLVAEDFNGDGFEDIVSISHVGQEVMIHWGDGNGNFSEKDLIYEFDVRPSKVRTADLDGDGDFDLIIGYSGNSRGIIYIPNEGNGNFGDWTLVKDGFVLLYDIELGDLEGDGDIDILTCMKQSGSYDDKVVWFENDGEGNWGNYEVLPDLSGKDFILKDLNSDGLPEVFKLGNNFKYYSNNMPNGFTSSDYLGGDDARAIVFDDLNGDTYLDIIVAERSESVQYGCFGQIHILYNQANEGFSDFSEVAAIDDEIVGIEGLMLGDLDGDGDLDLIGNTGLSAYSSCTIPKQIIWYERISPTEFGNKKIITKQFSDCKDWDLTDFNEDGVLDFVFTTWYDSYLAWLPGPINVDTPAIMTPIGKHLGLDIDIGDVNEDGYLDFLSTAGNINKTWLFLGTPSLAFNDPVLVEDPSILSGKATLLEDFNLDGHLDLISHYYTDSLVFLSTGNGTGQFSEPVLIAEISSAGKIFSLELKDVNGSGELDLFVQGRRKHNNSNYYDYFFGWCENLGNETFGPFQEIAQVDFTSSSFQSKMEYIDGDNYLDLVVYNNELPVWFSNDGFNNFTLVDTIGKEEGNLPNFNQMVDMDNDGDMDVFCSQYPSLGQMWGENDGMGNFDEWHLIEVPEYAKLQNVTLYDIDLDGDIDVFGKGIIDFDTSMIAWIENIGDGEFGPLQIVDVGGPDFYLSSIADFNQDGIVELMGYRDNKLVWFNLKKYFHPLEALVFWDENQNGIYDLGEGALNGFHLEINPSAVVSVGTQGMHYFVLREGAYQLLVNEENNPLWQLTTSNSHSVVVDSTGIDSLLTFGFAPIAAITSLTSDIGASASRCNSSVNHWITYTNNGTTYASGYLSFTADFLTTFVSASSPPDSISENTYFWAFEDLAPTHSEQINIVLQMPDESFVGETIYHEAEIVLDDGIGIAKSIYSSNLACAVDPNDKLVDPKGLGDQHYTEFEDTLNYTVRFQNTGNDTALNIYIVDTLSQALDLSTFEFIASSHSVRTEIKQLENIVSFYFDDIYLPDSIVDELGSHGFVKFQIQCKEDLPENTFLTNRAGIYFDLNQPIITNTVNNLMVSELPSLPVVAATPNELDFGEVSVQNETAELNLLLQNNGDLPYQVTNISFDNLAFSTPATAFAMDGNTDLSLPVAFNPQEATVYNSTMLIQTDVGEITVQLTGIGILGSSIENVEAPLFAIYPNPNTGAFIIDFKNNAHTGTVKIFNQMGEKVYAEEITNSQKRLQLQGLSAGVYYVEFQTENKTRREKIVVF